MNLTCIGVGPGDPELLTLKAVRYIKEADVIIAPVKKEASQSSTAATIAKIFIEDRDKLQYMYFPMKRNFEKNPETKGIYEKNVKSIKKLLEAGKKVVYLTLGDVSVYSTFYYLASAFENVEYIPGIPSFIHAASLSKEPLCLGKESFGVVNMSQTQESLRQAFSLHNRLVVMKVSMNPLGLKELIEGFGAKAIFMSNIGMDNEVIRDDLEYLEGKVPYFTVAQVSLGG